MGNGQAEGRRQKERKLTATYREEAVARSICSSRGDVEENQPAILKADWEQGDLSRSGDGGG
jgi:hypothetical protein